MNKVILSGRLTKDPTSRMGNEGLSIVSFTVACDRIKKGEADFISCVAFGKTAEFVEKYFKKGAGIELTGRIQTGSYTNKDNQKVYTTDVAVETVEFPKGNSNSSNNTAGATPASDEGFMNVPDGIDEELPFK